MARFETDICVIGAGSGGLSVAAAASQMGARVVLLEGGEMGGDCLNHGCVPSKALLAAGRHARAMLDGRRFGVTPVVPEVSFDDALGHVRRVIDALAPHDSQQRFESLGVRVIRKYGRFISPSEIVAGDDTITARRFVIATGSSPFLPPLPGLAEVPCLTNETIFDLEQQPEHLIVIGAGPVGLEMAQAHARLGSRVTVIEAMQAMRRDDRELVERLLDRLRAEGVAILENTAAERISRSGSEIAVETSSGRISGSHLLVAAGRVPNVARLNLEAAGIRHDRRGIGVDAGLRTSNRKVYALGDVIGAMPFTHAAGYQASLVARSALFALPARARYAHVPWATYTDPELAQIGLTEAEARRRHGDAVEVLRCDVSASDRAIADGNSDGLLKVMVLRGRPVGVSILGPQAGELIGTWALMMANGLKMKALMSTVLPYPTLGELNRRAAGAYFSPKLFDTPWVKRVVGFVQRRIP